MSKNMNKITSLILATIIAAVALTGCSKSVTGGSNPGGSAQTPAQSGDLSPLHASNGNLDPDNPITITLYSYSLSLPTMRPGMDKLLDTFNETVGKEKGVIVVGVEDTGYALSQADIIAGEQVNVIQHVFSTLDMSKEFMGIQAYEDIFPAD